MWILEEHSLVYKSVSRGHTVQPLSKICLHLDFPNKGDQKTYLKYYWNWWFDNHCGNNSFLLESVGSCLCILIKFQFVKINSFNSTLVLTSVQLRNEWLVCYQNFISWRKNGHIIASSPHCVYWCLWLPALYLKPLVIPVRVSRSSFF